MKLVFLVSVFAFAVQPGPPTGAMAEAPANTQVDHALGVTWVGATDGIDEAERTTTESIERLGASVSHGRRQSLVLADLFSHDASTPAVAYVDLRHAGIARIYVVDPSSQRVFIRTLPIKGSFDAVVIEELALVLSSSFEVLLDGGEIGISRENAEQEIEQQLGSDPAPSESLPAVEPPTSSESLPAPVEPPGASSKARLHGRVGVDLGYHFRALAPGAWLHGPTLGLSGRLTRRSIWFGASLRGAYYPPSPEVSNRDLGLRLTGGELSLALSTHVPLAKPVALSLEAGPVVTVLDDRTRALVSSAEAFEPRRRTGALARISVGVDLFIGGPASFVLGVYATANAVVAGYVYQTADTNAVVLAPWPVQPGAVLRLGGSFELGGRPR